MKLLLLIATLALTACAATPYEATTAKPIDKRIVRITVEGNSRTDAATVSDYLLLKAAETTLEDGLSGFLIISAENNSSPQAVMMVTEDIGAVTSAQTGTALVRLLTAEELETTSNAFDAQNIWNNLAPRYLKRRK